MEKSKQAKDPVCGMLVQQKDPSLKTHYKNKEYCFCCKECLTQFKNQPEKFSK